VTNPFDLSGRVAVVTAGCAGVGLAIAQLLHSVGASVVVTSRSRPTVEEFPGTGVDAAGPRLQARHLDFEPRRIDRFFRRVASEEGSVEILVNAAGGRHGPVAVEDLGPSSLTREFTDSVVHAFMCSRSVVALREITGIQSIVNIGSVYGVVAVDHRIYPDPAKRQTSLSYAAAKGALIQMTRYLAAYWAGLGVRVNCVSPGGIRGDQDRAFYERYCARVPTRRMSEPHEVAAVVCFLASDAAGHVTGQNILVDGGLSVW